MAVFCGRLQGRSNGSLESSSYERLSESSRLIPYESSTDHQHSFRRNSAWTSVLKAFFSFKKNIAKTTEAKRRSSWIPGPHDPRWPVQGW
ncbi:hypothetical protein PHJA_002810800 [Phtheirospermum japonicum]|uniref:Uncharacterized protein n=1 Tax=Phtheirospermum japonicum TaxID=374723 RepID=A0A830D224_9LAMI|nr:hypothetical protein PHJA_002810800 [Phtheirospermum japonicum]